MESEERTFKFASSTTVRNLKQDAIPDQNLPSVKVSSMCYACKTITVDAGEANTKLEVEIL